MTSIEVKRTTRVAENRSWLASHGSSGFKPSVTLDVSKFTAGTHYPNGFIPSGLVVGKVTATGLYGPYDNAATDGREVARGHLYNSVAAVGATKIGNAIVDAFEHVTESRLPANHGLDAAAKTDLSQIKYL